MRSVALVILAACNMGEPTQRRAPLLIGPQLGQTHVTELTPPRASTAPPPALVETDRSLEAVAPAVQALGEHPADRAKLATAIRSLADALLVVASDPDSVEVIGEQRRVMLAELDLLETDRGARHDEQSTRLRVILDRAALALARGSARSAKEQRAYSLVAAQAADAVRQIDPSAPMSTQRPRIVAALRIATNALHVSRGLAPPFANVTTARR